MGEALEPADHIWAYTNARGSHIWTPMKPAIPGAHEEQEYVRADIYGDLARQAEALQQEVDSLKQTRQHSREASAALHDAFMAERKRVEALQRENERLCAVLGRLKDATPISTNSSTAKEAFSFVYAVAATAFLGGSNAE